MVCSGAGRTELLECLMGLHPEMAGSIFLDSKSLGAIPTSVRIEHGLAMTPEDRQVSGLVQSLSVMANMTLSSLGRFVKGVRLSRAAEKSAAAGAVADLRIKTPVSTRASNR